MAETKQRYNFGFKRVTDYDASELDIAVAEAKDECAKADLDFYAILRGIDAYMEKRRRKQAAAGPGRR